MKEFVRAWHQAALPFITTQPFEETWLDFAESWPKIKFVSGQEPIYMAYQAAVLYGPPSTALQYEQDALRRLISLCRELQCASGDKPFFLAGRIAAEIIEVSHTQVAKWLRLLVIDKVLDVASAGRRHHASEYWYRGGQT